MYCTNCSYELASESPYCPHCGTKASGSTSRSASAGRPAPAPIQEAGAAGQAVAGAKKSKWRLLVVVALVAVVAWGLVGFFGNRSLEKDLNDEALQEIATSVKEAHGVIPCDVRVRVSDNTILVCSQLSVGVNTLLGTDVMRYYEGLGIDQAVAQVVFDERTVSELTETCRQLEGAGYSNVEIIYEEIDRDGGVLLSRTFTSNG